jgi:hypothetical protein
LKNKTIAIVAPVETLIAVAVVHHRWSKRAHDFQSSVEHAASGVGRINGGTRDLYDLANRIFFEFILPKDVCRT